MLLDLDYRPYSPPDMPGVSMRVRPLSLGAYQEVAKLLSGLNTEGGGHPDLLKELGEPRLAAAMAAILPAHVTGLTGVQVREDGATRAIEAADLAKYGPLHPLGTLILLHLFSISVLSEDDAKN